ncbi:MAG: HAD family hydrolase [Bacillota bacterium]|nr:HAD family hydrolase [Bacillota bacterium]
MGLKLKTDKKLPSLKGLNYLSLIRAAVAIVILIIANSMSLDNLIYIIISLAAILVAGFDIVFAAVDSIQKKDYFSYDILILFAAVVAFSAGCIKEAVLLVVFYLFFKTLLAFIIKRIKATSSDYIQEDKPDDLVILRSILSQKEASETAVEEKISPILDSFAKAAVLVGILYAAFMPLITDITYLMSIRRGLMLILLASPLPMLASLPVSSIIGISHSASCGVFIRDAETLEKAARLNTVVIDKADVITNGAPSMVSFNSPVFDNDTFIKLAAYVAYNSEQRIAASILGAYKGDFHPEIIERFKEIPGSSLEISVKNIPICLCTKEVLATRKIDIPAFEDREGLVLYMTVAGRYAGGMQFSEAIKPTAISSIEEIKALSDVDVILITEDNRRLTKILADELNVDEYICECNTEKKIESVEYAVSRLDEAEVLAYVSAENLDYHTDADIDVRIGYTADNADMLLAGSGLECLPYACSTAKRTLKIQRENLIFAIIVKLALIFMAFAGIATLWFVVMADMAAALLTVINTTRISDTSVVVKIKEKL